MADSAYRLAGKQIYDKRSMPLGSIRSILDSWSHIVEKDSSYKVKNFT